MPDWIPPLVCAAIGTAVVVALTLRARANETAASTRGVYATNSIQQPCSVCQKQMVIPPEALVPLKSVEMALCVRIVPALNGRKLAEYTCPYCEAVHCFTVDTRTPEWIGANLYSPQTKGTRCLNCSRPLKVAPWGEGAYDKRLPEAPLQPDYGLECSKCGAVVCVQCTVDATRGGPTDGAYKCPRCFRLGVDKTFHPI